MSTLDNRVNPRAVPLGVRFCGALGHTWVVTVRDSQEGERVGLECSTGADAYRYYVEQGERAVSIYSRGKGRWKRVSATLAMIS